MHDTAWTEMERLFTEFPIMRASGVSEAEIQLAERKLGREFSPSYRQFLLKYGGAMVGALPVLGLRQAEVMGDDLWNVVSITRQFWAENWAGTADWYIVSVDGAGNPIGIDEDGGVWISDHNAGKLERLADDFALWVEQLLRDTK